MNTLSQLGAAHTSYGTATIQVGRYPAGGATCVQLITSGDGSPEPLAMLSCNLVPDGARLAADEFTVKVWLENAPLIQPLLGCGLFEDTGRRIPTGFVEAPVWRMLDPAHVPAC